MPAQPNLPIARLFSLSLLFTGAGWFGGCSTAAVDNTDMRAGSTSTSGATGTSASGTSSSAASSGVGTSTAGTSSVVGSSATGASGTGAAGSSATGATGAGGSGGAGPTATGGAGGRAGAGGVGGRSGNGGAPIDAGRSDAASDASATGGSGGSTSSDASATCIKRGVGTVFAVSSAPADIAALAAPTPGISWFYSWGKTPATQIGTSYVAAGVEFVPMVWGNANELMDDTLASKIRVSPGTQYLLGYNEPNFTAQSNLTPARAAAAWPFLQRAADQLGLKTVGPGMNNCGSGCNQTDPFVWLDQFLAACVNCRIDYLAFHSYSCDSNWFINTYMRQAVDKYYTRGTPPRKLWITELGCADAPPAGGWSVAQVQAYMRTIIPWLESSPAIFRYSWFGDTTGRPTGTYVTPNNALLAGPGQLTAAGMTYTTVGSLVCQQ